MSSVPTRPLLWCREPLTTTRTPGSGRNVVGIMSPPFLSEYRNNVGDNVDTDGLWSWIIVNILMSFLTEYNRHCKCDPVYNQSGDDDLDDDAVDDDAEAVAPADTDDVLDVTGIMPYPGKR